MMGQGMMGQEWHSPNYNEPGRYFLALRCRRLRRQKIGDGDLPQPLALNDHGNELPLGKRLARAIAFSGPGSV